MYRVLLSFILYVVATSVTNASGLHKHKYIDTFSFEKRINIIHSKVVDLTDIFALHHIKEFNEIYFAPLRFEESVIQYLQEPAVVENKIIAICSMTKLPLNKYINILNVYFILYSKDKIDEGLLNSCIFNEFDTDNRLIRQYKNPQVRALLSKMITCKTLSRQFKNDLKETLNGKRFNDLKRTGHLGYR